MLIQEKVSLTLEPIIQKKAKSENKKKILLRKFGRTKIIPYLCTRIQTKSVW